MEGEKVKNYLHQNWVWLLVNGVTGIAMGWLLVRITRAPFSSDLQIVASGETQNIVLFSGKAALVLLVLSLACTPMARILGFNRAITVRKALGLWGVGFAMVHGLFIMGGTALLSESQAWFRLPESSLYLLIRGWWTKAPYAPVGIVALLLLIPLALTSSRAAMRRLGRNWKRLHRLVYLAVPLAVWHYGWRAAWVANPSDYAQAILFGLLVGILLLVRIPSVRRPLTNQLGKALIFNRNLR